MECCLTVQQLGSSNLILVYLFTGVKLNKLLGGAEDPEFADKIGIYWAWLLKWYKSAKFADEFAEKLKIGRECGTPAPPLAMLLTLYCHELSFNVNVLFKFRSFSPDAAYDIIKILICLWNCVFVCFERSFEISIV